MCVISYKYYVSAREARRFTWRDKRFASVNIAADKLEFFVF